MSDDTLYSETFQLQVIAEAFRDYSFATTVLPNLKESYFSKEWFRNIYKVLFSYVQQNKSLPPNVDNFLDHFKYIASKNKLIQQTEQINSLVAVIYKKTSTGGWAFDNNSIFVREKVNTFIKKSAMRDALMSSVPMLERDDYEGIIKAVQKAATVGVVDTGIRVMKDASNIIEAFKKSREPGHRILTPYEDLNYYTHGGIGRQELFVVMAPPSRGKCQKFDTKILLSDGSYVTLEYLKDKWKNYSIITMGKDHKLFPKKIDNFYNSGIIDCYRLTVNSGITTEPSSTHPYYTLDGWKKVTELKIGDRVAVSRKYNCFNEIDCDISIEDAELIGLFLADGSITHQAGFSNTDDELLSKFKALCTSKDFNITFREENNNTVYAVDKTKYTNSILEFLRKLNLFGLNSHTKFIPDYIFKSSKEKIAKFLGAFYACDGWVHDAGVEGFELGLSLCNIKMLTQIRSLLLRFDIKGTINKSISKYEENGEVFDRYTLSIRNYNDLKSFFNSVPIPLAYKQNKLKELIEKNKDRNFKRSFGINNSFPKELWGYIDKKCKEQNTTFSTLLRTKIYPEEVHTICRKDRNKSRYIDVCRVKPKRHCNITEDLLRKFAVVLKDDFLLSLVNGDIYFDEITELEYIGKHQCYDLTIEDTHNFIANDMIVHNTMLMCNLAAGALSVKKKVVYYTLEMSELKIAVRLMQILGNFTQDDILINSSRVVEKLEEINKVICTDTQLDEDGRVIESIVNKDIIIKQYPTKGSTINIISSHLALLRANGFIPDIVFVDYADLMTSIKSYADKRNELSEIYMQLRDLAIQLDVCMVTASQTNRGALAKEKVAMEDVAEDFGKIAIADIIIALSQLMAEKGELKYTIDIVKNRDGEADKYIKVYRNIGTGEIKQFATDSVVKQAESARLLNKKQI